MKTKTRRAGKDSEQYLVIDHNIVTDMYVTYIVDIWSGDLNDPATGITRYIGVWKAEDLETEERGAFDPDFSKARTSRSYYYGDWQGGDPQPLLWEALEETKKPDKDASDHKEEHEQFSERREGYYSHSHNSLVDQYQAFLDAIDRVARDESDEEAWTIINTWRNRQNAQYER